MDDTYYLGLLADACARAGRPAEARSTLEEALAAVPRGGRFFCDAELHRRYGEVLVALGAADEGEARLARALAVAREQGSPALERGRRPRSRACHGRSATPAAAG